ncbi:hypothetical protein [Haloechinothrix salitolerans]|uniref:SnoaL-like domain-containing protein n=1 Tax=Haloechinothrix salitolerans TaxID=926830 RepID=A0ABW2C5S6_9PSEU
MQAPAHRYSAGIATHDISTTIDSLTRDVSLHSPVLASYRFRGADDVAAVLTAAAEVVSDPEVVADFGTSDRRLVNVRATVDGRPIEITHLLRLDDADRVSEIRVYVRPLPGLAALLAGLGPRLAGRHSRMRAVFARVSMRPIAFLAPLYDRVATRLVTR